MSTSQDLTRPHKCVAAKCKGVLLEPIENYGYWAYWHGEGSKGWHSKRKVHSKEEHSK